MKRKMGLVVNVTTAIESRSNMKGTVMRISESDKAQIKAMKRIEWERVVYENSRRDCFDLARNPDLSVKDIHAILNSKDGWGAGAISLYAVRRLCRYVRG
jgi:hypothetical protein